jgi:hypothetical protein
LSSELSGTGGGYGKHAALPLDQIADRFDACVADPSMRSVSAVLRITREQLESRGSLGSYPWVAALFGTVAVIAFAVQGWLPVAMQNTAKQIGIGAVVVTALLLVGVLSVRRDAKAAIVHEREIRRLALDALEKIVTAPGFKPKPLDWSQALTLRRLMERAKRSHPSLVSLLSLSE